MSKSIQVNHVEEDTTMPYRFTNKTMQANIYMTCYPLLASWDRSEGDMNYQAIIKQHNHYHDQLNMFTLVGIFRVKCMHSP